MTFLAPKPLALPQPGRLWLVAAAIFAAGAVLGAVIAPALGPAPVAMPQPVPHPAAAGLSYPADVIRVIDGDTFDARVRIWPGMEAVTRVRLRGVDAPELKARCDNERVRAVAARDALSRMLNAGGVGIRNVAQDKYGGRVDADASSADTPDAGEALIALGLARRYHGGRRQSWCG